jgi:hypothetical protein
MKRSLFWLAPALSVAFVLAHGTPKKQTVPLAVFGQARYVYVETPDGDAFTPGLLPEDRQAVFDVQKGIQGWNRYVLTPKREEAELIFVVRKGSLMTGSGHVGIGVGNHPNDRGVPSVDTSGQGNNAGGGVEVGPPDDLIFVYTNNSDGRLGTLIWNRSEPDGLRSPRVPLLREIESAVDSAYPRK